MSLRRLSVTATRPTLNLRPHVPQRRHASILFALSALSNSRETQHFNKATRLSRVEHSPALKLIENSEVAPFRGKATDAKAVGAGKGDEGVRAGQEGGRGVVESASMPAGMGGVGAVSSAGSGDGSDGGKPKLGGEAAANTERPDIDNAEALKIGRAVLGDHTPLLSMQRELKDLRVKYAKLEEELAEKNTTLDKYDENKEQELKESIQHAASFHRFSTSFALIVTIGFLGFLLWVNPNISKPPQERRGSWGLQMSSHEKIDHLERELYKYQQDETARIMSRQEAKAKQTEAAEEVARTAKAKLSEQATQLRQAERAAKTEQERMAEWTRQAEDLRRVVGMKKAGTLSAEEERAYLEALVLLGLEKRREERRWWKSLFWRQP